MLKTTCTHSTKKRNERKKKTLFEPTMRHSKERAARNKANDARSFCIKTTRGFASFCQRERDKPPSWCGTKRKPASLCKCSSTEHATHSRLENDHASNTHSTKERTQKEKKKRGKKRTLNDA